MDPIAVWGAVTGSVGSGVALRREDLSGKRHLAVAPGIYLNTSRIFPGRITHGWAVIVFWNRGGRPLAVEHAGFEWVVSEVLRETAVRVATRRAEVHLEDPIELPVDGPTRKVYTPLG